MSISLPLLLTILALGFWGYYRWVPATVKKLEPTPSNAEEKPGDKKKEEKKDEKKELHWTQRLLNWSGGFLLGALFIALACAMYVIGLTRNTGDSSPARDSVTEVAKVYTIASGDRIVVPAVMNGKGHKGIRMEMEGCAWRMVDDRRDTLKESCPEDENILPSYTRHSTFTLFNTGGEAVRVVVTWK